MHFGIRKLAFNAADHWTGENDISHRTEADNEYFHAGVLNKKRQRQK
jgi:hypothetical protein